MIIWDIALNRCQQLNCRNDEKTRRRTSQSSLEYKPSSQFQLIYWRMLTIREVSPKDIKDCL
ncbi:hypothetical protein CRE_26956 [Caenorhabditis remanei]|uniref:Uncharacterized protein n=1 Tax=Caenorhabditis remanei TaxID=31234 RepID=E3LPG6_CAERE|nr:hypothetical protein CRE_26956 [Caenorhabditis remanei]